MSSKPCSRKSKEPGNSKFDLPRHFLLAFYSLSILAFAAAFSTTTISVALLPLAQKFHLSISKTFWLGTSTALTSTIFQPCCACLSDVLGRKWALSLSAATLTFGSLISAVAQNYPTILTGRCFQGIGAGGISAITDIIITDTVPLRLRGKWFAFISIPWAIGTTVGPIISGALTKAGDWRWIFAIIVIMSSCAIIACLWTLPSLPTRQDSLSSVRNVDFVGFTILATSLVATLVPIMQATVVYSWQDPRTLVPLVLGIVGLCIFLIFEQWFANSPLVPLSRFRNRSCLLTFLCTTLHGLVLWCLMYYLPVYYQSVKGLDVLKSGLAVLPETLTIVPASIAIGFLVSWTGRYRWAIWLGWTFSAAGMGILYFLDEHTSTIHWIGLNLAAGIGMGILFGAMGFAIQASVDAETVPLAVTLYSFWRAFGAALGISIGSAIFSSELEHNPFAGGGVEPESLPTNKHIRVTALRKIWIFCAIVCTVSLIASFGIQSFELEKPSTHCGENDTAETKEKAIE